jgi:chromate transporter
VLSIGGNTVALSDIDRYAVNTVHWLTGAQFVAFFAISQALPGPNGMALVLIGQQAAGLPGAITALIAKLVPTSLMAYSGAAWYERNHERVWVKRLRVALPPVTVGLLLAATFTLARQVDVKASRILMTAVAAAIVYWRYQRLTCSNDLHSGSRVQSSLRRRSESRYRRATERDAVRDALKIELL